MLDNCRKKSRIQILPISDPESPGLQTEAVDTDLSNENRQRVRAALARLSETDLRVLVLRYGLNWSSKKIAVATDVAPKTIDMQLVRARRALAKHFIHLKPGRP